MKIKTQDKHVQTGVINYDTLADKIVEKMIEKAGSSAELKALLNRKTNYGGPAIPETYVPKVGDICMGLWLRDNRFYRCLVMDIQPDCYVVKWVDNSTVEKTPVLKLPKKQVFSEEKK